MKLYTYISALLLVHVTAFGQTNLQAYTEQFSEQKLFKHAIISASVVDLESGEDLVALNAEKSLTPASSLKLVTSYTALFELGPNFQFETKLAYDGKIEDGVLKGNVYMVGDGDPSFGSLKMSGVEDTRKVLKRWHAKIANLGINCIDGDIISDESVFNSFPVCPSWQWNDLGNYYATGAWGLNVYDNEYKVVFQQNKKVGALTKIRSHYPKIWGLKLINEVLTGEKGSGDNAYIFGGPYDYSKRIVGTIPPGDGEFAIKGAIPDPPMYLAHLFQEYLSRKKIKSNQYKTQFYDLRKDKKRVVLDTVFSPKLSLIVRKANLESNNLFCEVMLKKLGHVKRQEGSGGQGKRVIKKFLRRNGISADGLFMEDGSGLSVRNRMSAGFMTGFLEGIAKKSSVDYVIGYLPRAGISGTIRSMFKGSKARGRVYAKSGSMTGIASYSGYIHAKSGKWYAFCIIVNGYSEKYKMVRGQLQKYMTAIYKNG